MRLVIPRRTPRWIRPDWLLWVLVAGCAVASPQNEPVAPRSVAAVSGSSQGVASPLSESENGKSEPAKAEPGSRETESFQPGAGEPRSRESVPDEEMQGVREWSHYVDRAVPDGLGMVSIGSGAFVVADATQWLSVHDWLGVETPRLDFERSVVLVAVVAGRNRVQWIVEEANAPTVDAKVRATKRGGPGFSVVLREVVRQPGLEINGVTVDSLGS